MEVLLTVNWILRGDVSSGFDMSNEVTDGANNSTLPVSKTYLNLGTTTGPGMKYRHIIILVQFNIITHTIYEETPKSSWNPWCNPRQCHLPECRYRVVPNHTCSTAMSLLTT